MKNWTRTSLIFLAFSIGACESQGPTAPTSSLTQSGALATGAQGQMTTLTDGGTGDIQQARGGKPCEEGDTRPKCNDEGNDSNRVAYSVLAEKGSCPFRTAQDQANAWASGIPGFTREGDLHPRWTARQLTVSPKKEDGVLGAELRGVVVIVQADHGTIDRVTFYMRDDENIKHRSEGLTISPVGVDPVNGFTINVDNPSVTVFKLKNPSGGPVVGTAGTICVGDLVYTPL